MLDLSTEFSKEMFSDNRNFLAFLDVTLSDGTVLNLENKDVWQNSLKIEDATSASGTFSIGAAVTGKMTVTLNNIYDTFSEYDFADAEVIVWIGLQLAAGLEKIRVGTYIVDEADYNGSTITLSCLDFMSKLDIPYTNSKLIYPAKISSIMQDVCVCCGIIMASADFDNRNYEVMERPTDEALTFGDIVAMVAQIAGCWAKMDAHGRLKLDWYKMEEFEKYLSLDGGQFDSYTPYLTGEDIDGGNFADYSSGDGVDGGKFENQKEYHHIFSTKSISMSTDDVVITGIRVTEEFEETETEIPQTWLEGEEGYVIEISGNALIQKGRAQIVAEFLYDKVVGMRFRPLTVEALSNPSVEAGDIAYVTDRKQNSYQTFISTREFNLGGTQRLTCDAETPSRNRATQYSEMTKAVVKARKERKKELTAYDLAIRQLTNLMTQSFGVFKTEEKQEDGSIIYYLHNKPELATSSIIWKMTADAFGVSIDGGNTWNAGMDANGNAVVNVLSAIGINADWINTGDLVVGGNQTNIDGCIKIYDAEGKCVCSMSKDGIIFDSANIQLDKESNMTLWGDVIANSLSVKDEIRITTQYGPNAIFPSSQALCAAVASNPFDGGVGNATCLHVGSEFTFVEIPAVYSGQGMVNNLSTNNAMISGFQKEEYAFEISPPSGVYNVTCVGTVHQSGVFMLVEGEMFVHATLAAGKAHKTPVTIFDITPPNHRNLRVISNDGTYIFEVTLDTSGYLTVRNLSTEDYETAEDSYIPFRFDYTLL